MTRFEELCNEYRENKRLIEELESINDVLKADIIAIMGERDTVIDGSVKAVYKPVTSSRVDTRAMKDAHPDIVAAYTTTATYRRFTVS